MHHALILLGVLTGLACGGSVFAAKCPCSDDPEGVCTCKTCKHGADCACGKCKCKLVLRKCPKGEKLCRCGCKEGWECNCEEQSAEPKPKKKTKRKGKGPIPGKWYSPERMRKWLESGQLKEMKLRMNKAGKVQAARKQTQRQPVRQPMRQTSGSC